jgi:putative hydroxymethylpyrimidine transport system ATP-binding protein
LASKPETDPLRFHLKGTFRHGRQVLFQDLSLTLEAGQWTCLLGSSGVGKSTLLKLLAGLPSGGEFSGDIGASDAQPIGSRIAYMAQSDLLYPWLTVYGNVVLGQNLRGEIEDGERANELIRQVGLQAHRDKRPHQLSGGMRQRAALARTLMEDTPLVLLDEPFSALDTRTRREMQELAFRLLQDKTVLLVTHDAAEALRLAQTLLVMTESGLEVQDIDAGEPLRQITDDRIVASQSRLLIRLNQADGADA